jgi:hypothetical protein
MRILAYNWPIRSVPPRRRPLAHVNPSHRFPPRRSNLGFVRSRTNAHLSRILVA